MPDSLSLPWRLTGHTGGMIFKIVNDRHGTDTDQSDLTLTVMNRLSISSSQEDPRGCCYKKRQRLLFKPIIYLPFEHAPFKKYRLLRYIWKTCSLVKEISVFQFHKHLLSAKYVTDTCSRDPKINKTWSLHLQVLITEWGKTDMQTGTS